MDLSNVGHDGAVGLGGGRKEGPVRRRHQVGEREEGSMKVGAKEDLGSLPKRA